MPGSLDFAADIALHLVVARDDALDEVVTEALATLATLADVDRAYVTLLSDDGTFENSHEWTASHIVPHRPAIHQIAVDRFPYSIGLAIRDEIMSVPDIDLLPEEASPERDSFASFGVRSVLQVPIRVDERSVGLVGFNAFRPVAEWSPKLIENTRRVGQAIGVALVRERASRSVRAAWEQAELANRAKDDLIASVSHELRTPLHALLGYAELMELDERSEGDRQALLEIQFNGHRLLTLVDDLIDMASTDRHVTESAEAEPILLETIAALTPVAELRDIRLEPPSALGGVTIGVAPSRLRQVVHCVLSGALQTLATGGTIAISAPAGPPDPTRDGTCALTVTMACDQRFDASHAITPLARALMDGYGAITFSADERNDRSARIDVVFDHVDRP